MINAVKNKKVKELDRLNLKLWEADTTVRFHKSKLFGEGTLKAYRNALIEFKELQVKSLEFYQSILDN